MAGARATCPDCGGPVFPDRERLCPRCGYPLMFMQPEVETESVPDAVARTPGERDSTGMLAPGPTPRREPARTFVEEPAPPPSVGEVACPQCRHRNPNTRVRCEQCGAELRPAWQVAPPPPLPEPVHAPPRRGYLGIIVAAVLVVAILGALGTYLYLKREGAGGSAAPPPPPAGNPPVLVDPGAVKADATSTNPDESRYKVASLLDGDPGTAWNSHGDRLRSNVGVKVTFTFKKAVRLVRVTVVNGYARNTNLYRGNERVKQLTVNTDSGSKEWPLKDTVDPQTLDLDGGSTKTVEFVIDSVYKGNKYKDVCITEVSFYERP